MTVKVGLTRELGVVCIGIGIFIFSVALVFATWMYLAFSPSKGAGLTLIPGLILYATYIVLTLCNLVGGAVVYFSSEDSKPPFSRGVKTVLFFGVIAQMLPVIYVIFFLALQ